MDKDLDKIKKIWSKLSPIETLQISLLVRFYIIRKKISETHPKQLVIPICLLQIFTFITIMILEPKNLIETIAISNFVIVGIGVFPVTLKRKKYHFV